jgi:hypothetical protein
VTDNIPQEPFYLLANLAVGGDWPGSPNASTAFPSYYDIDYIRIYENTSYMAAAAMPTATPSGGKNILHAAKISPVDANGKETKTFVPGIISWRVQVANQDGTPYRDARVTTELLDQDGNVKLNLSNWETADRLGWVTFTTFIKEPGTYAIRVAALTVISINASYDPQEDIKPVKITIK